MTATERLTEIKANLPGMTYPGDALSRRERDARDMLAALEAVLAEHEPMAVAMTEACSACTGIEGLVAYPCPTVEAVNEALGADQ